MVRVPKTCAVLVLMALACGVSRGEERKFFAHYMGCFPATAGWLADAQAKTHSLTNSAKWEDFGGAGWINRPLMPLGFKQSEEENAAFEVRRAMRAGLTPAYDAAKEMARVEGANGYRLPTEAEWEYVATGRGENRTYPWGEEPPQGMCNGAYPKEVLQSVDLHRNKTANRAVCVGSYATDVSRDGICDMGGNVLEWCHDNYHYDAPQEGRDPCDVRPAKFGRMNFRAIRGGYGYYGLSHRCCDREYNNPGYRGYVYIGFRVVKPQ